MRPVPADPPPSPDHDSRTAQLLSAWLLDGAGDLAHRPPGSDVSPAGAARPRALRRARGLNKGAGISAREILH